MKSQLTECWHKIFWKFDREKAVDSNPGSVTDVWGQTEVILDFMEILFLFLITSYTRGGRKGGREERRNGYLEKKLKSSPWGQILDIDPFLNDSNTH